MNIYAFNLEHGAEIHSTSFNPPTARRGSNFGSVPQINLKLPPTITDNEEYSDSTITNNLILHHYQQIQANPMCALIADIDNDGLNEFIVALSDRVVRSYRAVYHGEDMKLVGIHKWEFSDQIGSISLSTSWDILNSASQSNGSDNGERIASKKNVLVAQNGASYAKLSCYDSLNDTIVLNDNDSDTEIDQAIGLKPDYKNISVPPLRNSQISSEIISDIETGSKESESENNKLTSIVTADGLLMIIDDEDNIRLQCQLDLKTFSLRKYDIDNDRREELVICNWNGETYLVNLDGRIVTCQFDQPVSAFEVGNYYLKGYRMSCLVYATFTNSVYLFYNIDCSFTIDTSENVFLDYIKSNNPMLMNQLETLVHKLNINDNNHNSDEEPQHQSQNVDLPEFKIDSKLIQAILYGVPLK